MLREWRAIIRKPKFIVIILAISLIPSLYNIIFLNSMWDPYGETGNLPVAIVNKDNSVELNGKTLSVGENMIENMKNNKALDYHFVSDEEAKKGFEKGDYYMIVTLPEDLSKKSSSILTSNPEKMNIDYQTSSGRNFFASKISDSAMEKLKQSVSSNIINTYTSSIFSNMTSLKTGLSKAADGSSELTTGSQKLELGSGELQQGLSTLAASTITFSDGVSSLNSGLSKYISGVQTLHTGSSKLESGILTYTEGVGKVSTGLGTFSHGLTSYTSGVNTLNGGINKLNSNSNALVAGINQFSENGGQVAKLAEGAKKLELGIKQIEEQLSSSSADRAKLLESIKSIEQIEKDLLNNQKIIQNNIKSNMQILIANVQDIIKSDLSSREELVQKVRSTEAYNSMSNIQKKELEDAIASVGGNAKEKVALILNDIKELQKELEKANSLAENSFNSKSITKLESMVVGINGLEKAIKTQLSPGAVQLSNGLDLFINKYSSGTASLNKGILEYTNGVSRLAAGSEKIVSSNDQLITGISKLDVGVKQLTSNSANLVLGTSQLNEGLNKLTENSSTILNGTNKLVSGAEKISSASNKLYQGNTKLTNGLHNLTNGASILSSGLGDATEKLSGVATEDNNAKVLSAPLKLSKVDNDNVETNGFAMAPYMVSVSLFVIAISSNMMFVNLPSGRRPRTRLEWLKARFQVNGIISILSGILVYGAINLIGIRANYGWKTLLIIILGSMTFMALVTMLNVLDTNVGAFVSLILMLLQLGSSAGTYPLALTNKFFQAINPWLPMSYTVSGLRETISMGGIIRTEVIILTGMLIIFVVLGVIFYNPNKFSKKAI